MKKGKLNPEDIVDEICMCGHLKSMHRPSNEALAHDVLVLGHGPCRECDCPKFTWKDFVLKK